MCGGVEWGGWLNWLTFIEKLNLSRTQNADLTRIVLGEFKTRQTRSMDPREALESTAREERVRNRDPENWSSTEPHKVLLGQAWQRAG